MTLIDAVGWVATVLVLAAYSRGTRTFDRANALLWVLVSLPAFMRGAYNSVAISVVFGAIGTVHLIHRQASPDREFSIRDLEWLRDEFNDESGYCEGVYRVKRVSAVPDAEAK